MKEMTYHAHHFKPSLGVYDETLDDDISLDEVYVLVITPLRGIWRVYTHDARGRVAPEGRGRIYTSQITKKGCYR